jgi:hypothetical protein
MLALDPLKRNGRESRLKEEKELPRYSDPKDVK